MKRHMYFDNKDYLLRTHAILQEIKRYGGNKVYLEARKLLLVAWLSCREGDRLFLPMISYEWLLRNLESINKHSQKLYHFSSVEKLHNLLSFTPPIYEEHGGYFFAIPYNCIINKTPHQAHLATEKYIMQERERIREFEDWEDDDMLAEVEEEDDEEFDDLII